MQIFGLMIVRNEVDILRINILHHFSLGVDRFLIVDNGSTDGTDRVLQELSADGRLEWSRDDGPYRQSEITTELARKAFQQGADWVIPIDADEFWCAPFGDFRAVLETSAGGALQVEVLNFIQRREQIEATPKGLLSMTRRVPLPVGPLEHVRELVETRKHGYVEMMYSPKFISRPTAATQIAMGNHGVTGLPGPIEITGDIVCLHAVVRSRSILEAKVEEGRRFAELGLGPEQGWHLQRWTRLAEEVGLDDEWRANSYAGGCLDVYGQPHPVVFDPRLRDAVRVWVEQPEPGPSRQDETSADERRALLYTIQEEINAHNRASRRSAEILRSEVGDRDSTIRRLQAELHQKIGECNRIIGELQAELHTKVAERNRIITNIQAELHQKIGECDRIISELQAELHAKVDERDRMIIGLQAELHQKVEERDHTVRALQVKVDEQQQLITDIQAELHQKVGECNRIISELQAELHSKVGERDRTIIGLQAELQRNVEERDRMIAKLQLEVHGKVAERDRVIRELQDELETIHRSRLWPLVRALLSKQSGKAPK